MSDTTPDDELQELIERWRDIANADPIDDDDLGESYRTPAEEVATLLTRWYLSRWVTRRRG